VIHCAPLKNSGPQWITRNDMYYLAAASIWPEKPLIAGDH
jgi:hypothetical protein